MVEGDIRDISLLAAAVKGVRCVIHMACISNDPSFELDPGLSRTINYDCFEPMVDRESRRPASERFIYVSSSSVYGVSDAPEVTEDHPLVPLTDYNKYKGLCEPILLRHQSPNFVPVIMRPATVCGYSPRMRFDLTVNILTNHAVNKGVITVFGGAQKRPNIHIDDVTELYVKMLEYPDELIAGETSTRATRTTRSPSWPRWCKTIVEKEFPEKAPIQIRPRPIERQPLLPRELATRSPRSWASRRSAPSKTPSATCAGRSRPASSEQHDQREYVNVKTVKKLGLAMSMAEATRRGDRRRRIHRQPHGGSAPRGGLPGPRHRQPGGRPAREPGAAQGQSAMSCSRSATSAPGRRATPCFRGAKYVFHFAGIGDIVPSIDRPIDYMSTNVLGTVQRWRRPAHAGVSKFVYAASSSCYGLAEELPTTESAPIRPQYPYALSKYQGEQAVLHWGESLPAAGQCPSASSTPTDRGRGRPAPTARCSASSWPRSWRASR